MGETIHQHKWEGCNDLMFIVGEHKGFGADVLCIGCNMGAFTDVHGNVILHSVEKAGFKSRKKRMCKNGI